MSASSIAALTSTHSPARACKRRELAVAPESAPTLLEPFDLGERPRIEALGRVAEHHVRGASHRTRPAFGPVAVGGAFGQGHFDPVHAGGGGGGGGAGGVYTVVGGAVGGGGEVGAGADGGRGADPDGEPEAG